jgi:hypothetical protein
MPEYDSLETRLGKFEMQLPGFNQEGSRKVLEYDLGINGDKTISDLVEGTEVPKMGAAALGHKVEEQMSKFEDTATSDEVNQYFRDVAGIMGYEIGRNLDEAAEAGDLEQIAEDLYVQFSTRDKGKLGALLDYAKSGFSELSIEPYEHSREEVTSHLEDAIWMGYMDRK